MWAQAGLVRVSSSHIFLSRLLPADPARQTIKCAFNNTAANQTEALSAGQAASELPASP